MSALRGYLSATGAIVERDLRVFLSYRFRVFGAAISLLMSMFIFYYVSRLIQTDSFESRDQYFAYVVTGLLIVFVLHSAVTLPGSVRQELVAGTFERLAVSPFGPVSAILSMAVFPILFACVMAIFMFVLVALLFGVSIEWVNAPAALSVALLGASVFAALGLLMAACTVVFKQSPGVGLVIALLSLTGGVYFPVELLPAWLAWISEVQPFTPTIELLRHLLIDTDTSGAASSALLKLVAFAVVLIPLSLAVLRWAIGFSRRRGTLLEY